MSTTEALQPPPSMRCVGIENPGPDGVLVSMTEPTPTAGAEEVLVRVAAAGVNRPDCLQRRGLYALPPGASPLPGLEIAGIVAALGPGTTRWRIGDPVMALTHGGGYAEYCRVNETHCLPFPGNLSLIEAAALPETVFTVWYNVFMRAGLESGETFLVHGGSSGIGSTAIQLAKARGCRVITTAGSARKCRFCEQLGADHAIDYKSDDWALAARGIVGDAGVDVLLDMVAGSYMQKNLDLMARDGRYTIIAFLDGSVAELDMRAVLARRITITGSTLRPQTTAEKAAIASSVEQHVLPLIESRQLRPVIDSTFTLDAAQAAHDLMESSHHMGKIVLSVNEELLH